MDGPVTARVDRRAHSRAARTVTRWDAPVLVRPGREAHLIDISDGGALIEIDTPLRPGTQIQLQLSARDRRVAVGGRVSRCYVAAIGRWGIRYRGGIAFDARLSSFIGWINGQSVPGLGTIDTHADGQSLPMTERRP